VASYPFPYSSMPLEEKDFFAGLPHGGEFGYAMAKRHAHAFLDILSKEKDITFTYGILTNLYGPGDRFDIENGHVVPSLVAKANQAANDGTVLNVWGNGEATRDFLFIEDAARAIEHCIKHQEHPSLANGLVNISSAQEVSIRTLAECIAQHSGDVPIEFDKSGAVGVPRRVIDNTKLLASGFSGFTSIEEGIKATCKWYAENVGVVRR
ncbi:MAG: NAD-dependent epimerase/dehydratase family protein, partial [Bacteroidota bacterium]